jgi:hypothetical protein
MALQVGRGVRVRVQVLWRFMDQGLRFLADGDQYSSRRAGWPREGEEGVGDVKLGVFGKLGWLRIN